MKTSDQIRAEAVTLLCGLTDDLLTAQRDAVVAAMEAMWHKGYNHGYDDGYEKGQADGHAQGKREGRHERMG